MTTFAGIGFSCVAAASVPSDALFGFLILKFAFKVCRSSHPCTVPNSLVRLIAFALTWPPSLHVRLDVHPTHDLILRPS